MDTQLQQALTDLINKTLNGAEQAGNFLLGEIPEVVQQLLVWHGVKSFLVFVFGVAMLCAAIYANYRQYLWLRSRWDDIVESEFCPFLLINLLQLLWVPFFGVTIQFNWLQIWLAPKVWLLEYAASILK